MRTRTCAWLMGAALTSMPLGCGQSVSTPEPGTGGTAGLAGSKPFAGMGANANAGGSSGTDASGGIAGDIPPNEPCGNALDDGAREECDDGNLAGGDGCNAACRIEHDAICPKVGPCTLPKCGNGILEVGEWCDDGGLEPGDGCDGSCRWEPGWMCPERGVACRPVCGDLLVLGGEACDDGNTLSGDGCSRSCHVECEAPSTGGAAGAAGAAGADNAPAEPCEPVCGNGVVEADEDCDLGTLGNDGRYGGCAADCRFAGFCGDGVVESSFAPDGFPYEWCDNGSLMVAEPYGQPGVGYCTTGCRYANFCGDGFIDGVFGEQCDNGNKNGICGCTVDCVLLSPEPCFF